MGRAVIDKAALYGMTWENGVEDMRYDSFSYDIEDDFLNLWSQQASSRIWKVSILAYSRNWRGIVKADKFTVAMIPVDYTLDDDGKSVAIAFGENMLKRARDKNS